MSSGGFNNVVRALRVRNYRIYTLGNSISLIGTWLQRVAVGWIAWKLTHSGTWLGLVAFADLFPVVVLSPVAGTLADRVDRVRLMRLGQIVAMVQATVLAFLTWSGLVTIGSLFALTLLLGATNALIQPARLALIPSLVERSMLASAVAINSIVFNNARFIGPAVAGVVIAQGSIALAFAVNAASYVAFILALARLELQPGAAVLPGRRGGRAMLGASLEGYAYAFRHPGIGPMLLLFIATAVAARGFVELLPGFTDSVFGRGAQGLAWLTAATGLGAMAGGVWMVRRPGLDGLIQLIIANTLLMSVALLGFTATADFRVALVCLFGAGFALVATGVGAQTLVQSAVDPAMRGRVMGLYGMIFRGGPALNALLMGVLSSHFGLRSPLAAGAVICGLLGLWARLRRGRLARALEVEPRASPAA